MGLIYDSFDGEGDITTVICATACTYLFLNLFHETIKITGATRRLTNLHKTHPGRLELMSKQVKANYPILTESVDKVLQTIRDEK